MSDFALQPGAMQWKRDSAEKQSFPNWADPQYYADWSIGIPSLPYLPDGFNDQPVKPYVSNADTAMLQRQGEYRNTQERSPKRTFECPPWHLQTEQDLPRSCNGAKEATISDLIRHLRRNHCYVERCAVCKQFIFDPTTFSSSHGRNKCTIFQKQSRGDALEDDYRALFSAMERMDPKFWSRTFPLSPIQIPSGPSQSLIPMSASLYEDSSAGLDFHFQTGAWSTSSPSTTLYGSTPPSSPTALDSTNSVQPAYATTSSPKVGLTLSVQEEAKNEHGQIDSPQICPSCDRHYTGVWARRNLNRHMKSKHTSHESPDGLQMLRCRQIGCDMRFRREDALLVHERRSHPELSQPSPQRKKKFDF